MRWQVGTGSNAVIETTTAGESGMVINPGQSLLITSHSCGESGQNCARVVLNDFTGRSRRELPAFGGSVRSADVDPKGRVLVTADGDGVVRVGRLSGEEPHVLVGHKGAVANVAISPDLKWVASAGEDATLRVWPMPDLLRPPVHALPQRELVSKLKSLTNLRAVPSTKSPTGWSIDVGPFPGWKNVPEW
jgi:WD40 repeat protein